MIEITISPETVEAAREEADKIGNLKNSIREGAGNLYGIVGELLVAAQIGGQINNTIHFDLLLDDKKIDVKTKCVTSEPKPEYECSVAAYNTRQECDYYVFVRILKDFSKGWILGGLPKQEYLDKARFCKKGTKDFKSKFGWKFKASCRNLEIKDLKSLENLLTPDKIGVS